MSIANRNALRLSVQPKLKIKLKKIEQEEYNAQLNAETVDRWENEALTGKYVSHEVVCRWLETWGTEKEGEPPVCGK